MGQKILTVGGGSGQYRLLMGLKEISGIEITSVASMADNGGSTGRLRNEFGTLPPGDILKCIVALSPIHKQAWQILIDKFDGDKRLYQHNAGNMLLTTLWQYTGSFPVAIKALSGLLKIKGTVLPITTDRATLVAELADGRRIYGESAIDLPGTNSRGKIENIFLVPHHGDTVSAYPEVLDRISTSDYIFIGPGDLFTSIIPNLVVPGIKAEIQKTSAKVIFIMNVMTKPGETDGYRGCDFVRVVERYIGRQLDGIICNAAYPSKLILEKGSVNGADFVTLAQTEPWIDNRVVYSVDLLDDASENIRHDSQKLGCLIKAILSNPTGKGSTYPHPSARHKLPLQPYARAGQ